MCMPANNVARHHLVPADYPLTAYSYPMPCAWALGQATEWSPGYVHVHGPVTPPSCCNWRVESGHISLACDCIIILKRSVFLFVVL